MTCKVVSLLALAGLLAVIGSAPVCFDTYTRHQEVFASADHTWLSSDLDDSNGLVYLPPHKSRSGTDDLAAMMRKLIVKEMEIEYNPIKYRDAMFIEAVKSQPGFEITKFEIKILSEPKVQVIPVKQISRDIYCSTPKCKIGLEESVTVSTTHSTEIGASVEISGKPFGVGASFTASASYSVSHGKEASTALSYEFELDQKDAGYIGMVNAQISAQVSIRGYTCTEMNPASSHTPATTVATLSYSATGLSLPLRQGQSIVLGRSKLLNILVQHVSRQQLEISSKGTQVLAIRRGTNRSLLNGHELIKDTPTALKNGDSITLLEKDYQIIVEIPDTIVPLTSSTGETPTGPTVARNQSLTTPEAPTSPSRKDGPPEKKLKLETPIPLLDKQALKTIKDWKAIHTDTVRREAIQRNTDHNEDTSDSEAEAHNRSIRDENLDDNQSDISAESSFICSDLSDLEPERPVPSEWAAVHGKGHVKNE
ncbi:hypothetical protein BG005_006482 [Podila minutissima]|nr:hypothetical protein BG005_006482 [Podila minutissima]